MLSIEITAFHEHYATNSGENFQIRNQHPNFFPMQRVKNIISDFSRGCGRSWVIKLCKNKSILPNSDCL